MKLSLRQLLVIPFVLQIAIAVGITGFFSYRNGQKAVNDLATQLHQEISSRIELSLRTYLDQAHLMNETNKNALTQEFISLTDFTGLQRFFLGQLKALPSIDYVAWGSEQGEYIGIQRINNQQFNLEIVQNSTQDWFHIYRLTPTGERVKLLERLPNYDPRRRPWYQAANEAKTGVWTPIYLWFSRQTLAIDAVLPLYDAKGRLLGVLDTALYLSDISNFLRNVKIGKSGQSFIIDRSGLLIASSSATNPFIIKEHELQRVKAINSDDILIKATAKNIQNKVTNFESIQESIALDFKWEQERYIVKVFPFSDPRGIDWLICIVVPERDFMDLIIHNTIFTLFLCILSLIIATSLGIITAHRITAPLIRLSQASQAIAQGELDQNIELNREDELGILARSFNQMAMRLKRVFEELEIRVEERTAELKEAKAHIENYNKKLEERVYQRTAELSLALEDLQKTQIELLKQEEKLKFDAFHDSLTGLPNRALVLKKIQHLIEINQKESYYLYAVLFLDLDRFKVVNDSLGHLVGDELLKSVAHRLRAETKSQDTVARLGGDEFIILLENIHNEDEVTDVAQRIIEQLKRPFYINNNQIFTGVSIGITLSSMGYFQAEAVIRDADIAMYNAKHLGKGCYQVLTQAMQIPALQRLEQENQLRQALIRREFILNYQPIIALATGKITGFEVLIRWNNPLKNMTSPDDFIPIAEETGLIQAIDLWVLKQACYQMNCWNQQFPNLPPLSININLSPIDLKQINLVEKIQQIMDNYILKNWSLKLEITETCFLETLTFNKDLIHQLLAIGIELCIDDFGTGYSSLSRLHNFPLCTLKIDRSFVSQIQSEAKGSEIIHTIIMLAHSLGMDVIAEGIETKIQLEKLTELGCNYGQGYLISKPLDCSKATEFLTSQLS
ncbi:putative Diguanylate cyclase/phosphodiesterase [Planktothrix sp. PCC 11201]|uniref:bifunctional diguanylate cyclase/phosphodiesterase n=1 Tax=Planktothrix sp. PCC 11201 TaxID=1729650 RepID=UPI0009102BF6|nr:EAL domain-containing protein [Planktothrix sp. PCC 11201]SKB16203.1 putative Diguanylate cyclase/phosphodiesterase [Planktothrix sp. PCC 11201]